MVVFVIPDGHLSACQLASLWRRKQNGTDIGECLGFSARVQGILSQDSRNLLPVSVPQTLCQPSWGAGSDNARRCRLAVNPFPISAFSFNILGFDTEQENGIPDTEGKERKSQVTPRAVVLLLETLLYSPLSNEYADIVFQNECPVQTKGPTKCQFTAC